ncbi:homeobox and leucine zipper encoding b isoform X2 [Dicentrarchus labrax]|uniref:Homeobox domain-containing protein n=2 Tax=Dicentrarchus labrax TaxID=13489 RepID=A0A8P4FYW1_DICLA|nr:homeobox and leucine zipper encoding b isoform X2 [Dicentrarchus labrax]XP_051284722.1 homeobox and leucine zipper encoding b isoform X2 [Dicentrarchus labrax]XP_051284723.1 homeobox and leucine zipper encoding b isoform X2 [Dicentrarchus labrax]XP_051284724.1 homeobox and leucine zipper encoding b isoform X2 [Dicentrarchus labrax]XP_051284725.1 homeobox and leucine zipper encoding b isoform X2 [Dicentrarchus labrax]XP_051284727.1 homeobox and leucine zipper encoding b isoform X2 [Dicentrar
MRQTADGLRQKTNATPGGTLSEMNIDPEALSLNQNSILCLPLVSDSKRLIWVHSNEVNLQLDGAGELDKAFDRFPYLTQKQTDALAQRCSLHPDHVKVWFMVQRLRYGISWDYKDINKVRRTLKSSQRKEALQRDRGDVREQQSASKGRMMEKNVRANERWERKMKQEQPTKKEKDRKVEELEEDKRNTQKKRKRVKVGDKKRKKRAGQVEITGDEVEREPTKIQFPQSETTLLTGKKKKAKASKRLLSVQEWPAHKSFVVPDEGLDVRSPLTPLSLTPAFGLPPLTDNQMPSIHMTPLKSGFEGKTEMEAKLDGELWAESVNHSGTVTDVGLLKELIEETNSPASADGTRPRTKTQSQLDMMRLAFLHCQYPDSDDYNLLVNLIGVPRYELVQWFGDMRYYLKKVKPGWMNREQHSQALANIKYRQCLSTLVKAQPSEGGRKATCKVKPDRSESCGEDESV